MDWRREGRRRCLFLVSELVRRLNWVLYRVPADSLVPPLPPPPVEVVWVEVWVGVWDGWISLKA